MAAKKKPTPRKSKPRAVSPSAPAKAAAAAPEHLAASETPETDTSALSYEEEQFARLAALGMSQADAYRKATGTKAKDETIHEQASRWARKVAARIQELRAAAKEKANETYAYEYADAMREADEALAMAKLFGDSSAMSKAIALKAKLSGLETDPRKNEREPFKEMTEEELVHGINQNLTEAGYTIQ